MRCYVRCARHVSVTCHWQSKIQADHNVEIDVNAITLSAHSTHARHQTSTVRHHYNLTGPLNYAEHAALNSSRFKLMISLGLPGRLCQQASAALPAAEPLPQATDMLTKPSKSTPSARSKHPAPRGLSSGCGSGCVHYYHWAPVIVMHGVVPKSCPSATGLHCQQV
jgi:hypothetical protein